MTLAQATVSALLIMANYYICFIMLLQKILFIQEKYSFKYAQNKLLGAKDLVLPFVDCLYS